MTSAVFLVFALFFTVSEGSRGPVWWYVSHFPSFSFGCLAQTPSGWPPIGSASPSHGQVGAMQARVQSWVMVFVAWLSQWEDAYKAFKADKHLKGASDGSHSLINFDAFGPEKTLRATSKSYTRTTWTKRCFASHLSSTIAELGNNQEQHLFYSDSNQKAFLQPLHTIIYHRPIAAGNCLTGLFFLLRQQPWVVVAVWLPRKLLQEILANCHTGHWRRKPWRVALSDQTVFWSWHCIFRVV